MWRFNPNQERLKDMQKKVAALIFCFTHVCLVAQTPPAAPPPTKPLHRQYREGEALVYKMTGINEKWHYTVRAEGTVKKDGAGPYYEEFRWTDMTSDGAPAALAPAMA